MRFGGVLYAVLPSLALMCDDFHGNVEWKPFVANLRKISLYRPIVGLPHNAPILHTVYHLSDRYAMTH